MWKLLCTSADVDLEGDEIALRSSDALVPPAKSLGRITGSVEAVGGEHTEKRAAEARRPP